MMIPQPYPAWIVWDEFGPRLDGQPGDERASHVALVLGWRELPNRDDWSERATPEGPFPVVVHPDTGLVGTLGHDTAGSVSRMTVTPSATTARSIVEVRRMEPEAVR